jgi:predicted kinase
MHMKSISTNSAPKPTVAIVSGRPGSGKSMLARRIADVLLCPLVARDEIYEGMFHTVANDPELSSRDRAMRSTFEAFIGVIGLLVSFNVTFVAEAAFQDANWRIVLEPIVPKATLKVIHCVADPELAHRRTVRRRVERQSGYSPRAHQTAPDPGIEQTYVEKPFESLSLPAPSLYVATADGYDPSLDKIIAFITSPA